MTAFNPRPMSALLDRINDPVLKQEILDQYYADIGAYASGVQSEVFKIGTNVNQRLTDEFQQNRQAFGDMNATIATLVTEVRGSSAVTTALGAMFQSLLETVNEHGDDIASLKRAREILFEGRDRNYEAIMEVSRQLETLTARVTRYDHLVPEGMNEEKMIRRLVALLQQGNGE